MFLIPLKQFKLSAIVNCYDKTFYVDCCDTADCGIELMVFEAGVRRENAIDKNYNDRHSAFQSDDEFFNSINWSDVYVERFDTLKEAEFHFDMIVEHPEDWIYDGDS